MHTVGFGKEQAAHDVEMNDVRVASRAMADSRMPATVSFHQRGYAGRKATAGRSGRRQDAWLPRGHARAPTARPDGNDLFQPGRGRSEEFAFSLDPLAGEENAANNAVTRLVDVSDDKRRILYVEGEPRWEYKFIRRAEDDDKIVQVVSMLRTTENKIYRQGISDPKELADGFPSAPEDLFGYQGIIIGSVEAGYFTPAQQELMREFVDRRGGGLLFLGGRVFAWGWRMGRARAWRICFRRFCPTEGTHSTAIPRRSN